MAEDENKIVDKVEQLNQDLSERAQLISKPEYTPEADAEVEGEFAVSVLIDKLGNVLEAEIEEEIGFGMDMS